LQNSWIVFHDFGKIHGLYSTILKNYNGQFSFLKEVTKDIEPEGFAVSSVPDDGRQVAFGL